MHQELYAKIGKCATGSVYYNKGKPDDTSFLTNIHPKIKNGKPIRTIIIIDDLMQQIGRDKAFSAVVNRLFTTLCHHNGITCFLICQAAFPDKSFSVLHKNASYVILTKSHHDYGTLTRMYLSGYGGWLKAAANKCFYQLQKSYLLLDNNNWTDPNHRLKTGFLPGEIKILFVPKY